jgi:hypothetical protein
MDAMSLEQLVRNIDRRLDRVEQFLPTLATREELRTAIAPLATREEMHAAIQEAIAPLATKDELQALERRLERRIEDESEQSRSQSRAFYEDLKDDIRLLAEGMVSGRRTLDEAIRPILGNHEQRIAALEAGRGPAPVRRDGQDCRSVSCTRQEWQYPDPRPVVMNRDDGPCLQRRPCEPYGIHQGAGEVRGQEVLLSNLNDAGSGCPGCSENRGEVQVVGYQHASMIQCPAENQRVRRMMVTDR